MNLVVILVATTGECVKILRGTRSMVAIAFEPVQLTYHLSAWGSQESYEKSE